MTRTTLYLLRTSALALIISAAGNILSVQAADPDGANLVQQHRCYPCHNMTDNLLGPPYNAIAQRHTERRDAMVEVLAEKIITGGAGNWGVVPMVPNEQVSREEARVIAKWILEQTGK